MNLDWTGPTVTWWLVRVNDCPVFKTLHLKFRKEKSARKRPQDPVPALSLSPFKNPSRTSRPFPIVSPRQWLPFRGRRRALQSRRTSSPSAFWLKSTRRLLKSPLPSLFLPFPSTIVSPFSWYLSQRFEDVNYLKFSSYLNWKMGDSGYFALIYVGVRWDFWTNVGWIDCSVEGDWWLAQSLVDWPLNSETFIHVITRWLV